WYLRPRFETAAPVIQLSSDADVIGTTPLEIRIADEGAGLKSVTVTLSSGGTESTIAAEQYAPAVRDKKVALQVSKLPGVKEGPARLRVVARDASLWKFFKGNETVLEKSFTIDITPPTIELVADDR